MECRSAYPERIPETSTETRLRIQLLGPVRAWRGAAEIDLGSARRRAVFAILAAGATTAVARAEFVDGIWGDAPPAKAVGILHTYVSGLRKALTLPGERADAVLTTIESSYSLALAPDQLDELRFGQLQRDAQRSWENGDLHAAVAALDAAVGLWHGEGLDGLAVPFADLYRARLGELKATALERRAALGLILGRQVDAADGLADLVARFPLREGARGLLMSALYRAGRRDDALRLFDETRAVLDTELGIDPGPALQRLHGKILDGAPLSTEDIGATTWMPRRGVATVDHLAALDRGRPAVPDVFVGRRPELARLAGLLADLDAGRGACVWVEGEAGIGKSALLAKAFAADTVVWARGDAVADEQAVARLLAATEQACRRGPVVLVVEDLHRGRDTDLLAWTRLSRLTSHLPLLLVASCRTTGPELVRLHNAVRMVDGHRLLLDPLTCDEVAELAAGRLRDSSLLATAAGNPRDVNDILDAVGVEPDMAAVASGIAVRRLDALSAATRDVLRWAALLGADFTAGELTTVMRVPPAALAGAIREATTAGVLVEMRDSLVFRAESVRQQLLDSESAALHRQVAEALAVAGAPVERVAAQLAQAVPPVDPWAYRWLLANAEAVGFTAPHVATELLTRAVADYSLPRDEREQLAVQRIRLLCDGGQDPRADVAELLATTMNAEIVGELHCVHAHLDHHFGAVGAARARLETAARDRTLPAHWRARYQTSLVQFDRDTATDIAAVKRTATAALAYAVAVADPFAISEALGELWHVDTVRRDHAAALRHVDRALAVTAGMFEYRMDLLEKRAVTLDNLDRLAEASAALAQMRTVAQRKSHLIARQHVATAVHHYWLGRWDEAVAELGLAESALLSGTDLRWPTVLRHHGLAALIAARRGDAAGARERLRVLDAYPINNRTDEEGSDYVLAARALVDGPQHLDPLADVGYGWVIPRYQWLPLAVRLGIEAGDAQRVNAAVDAARVEADREHEPGRAHWALRWCQALVDRDPDELLLVSRRFTEVGRLVEGADALVDAATALAERGRAATANLTLRNALTIYAELGAAADISRAVEAMRRHGVRAQDNDARQPIVAGWHALSDIERRITTLVATGKTNPEIASELALPRRDVQWHISHIMQKLDVRTRAELTSRTASIAN